MLNRKAPSVCAVLVFVSALAGCGGRPGSPETGFVMGTVCTVTAYGRVNAGVYRDVFSLLRGIENLMSVSVPGSDIDRVNAAAGTAPVQVSASVFEVIERALYFAEISGGAFNPAVGPLVSLWGIGGENPRVPSRAEIDAVLPLVSWQDIVLDPGKSTVFLKRPGMALDLGAIAKGYAADRAAAVLREAGVRRAVTDLGGNILTSGEKPDRSPWRVGIQDPLDARGAYLGIVSGPEQAVVTSGVYERFFESEGRRYHHILSPRDGYPARSGLLSVTVTAGSSMDADALSTAVFVLGYEKGRALIESYGGAGAVFVFEDRSVRKTSGVDFTLTRGDYRLLQ